MNRDSQPSKHRQEPEKDPNSLIKQRVYNLLPFSQVATNYCFAIENAWITLLMIAYDTTYFMDRFIWLIPILMTLLIRPYVFGVIDRYKLDPIYIKVKIIVYLNLAAAIGIGFIILSPLLDRQGSIRRIVVCTIGWTLMDLCLGLSAYLTETIRERLQLDQDITHEKTKQQIREKVEFNDAKSELQSIWNNIRVLKFKYFKKTLGYGAVGQIIAYLLSATVCWYVKGRKLIKFYRVCEVMYGSCVILIVLLTAVLYDNLWSFKQMKETVTKSKQTEKIQTYGVRQLLETSFKERIFLLIHFIIFFMVDTYLIFTTLWIAGTKLKPFDSRKSYLYGVKIGCLYLVVFMIVSNAKIPKIKHWSLNRTVSFLKKYIVAILVLAVLSFVIFEKKIIFVFVLSGAVLISIYRNKIYPQMMREEQFRNCRDIVEKLEKMFRVSLFPLFVNVIFAQNALNNSPIWATMFFLNGILIVIFFLFVDVKKESPKYIKGLTGTENKSDNNQKRLGRRKGSAHSESRQKDEIVETLSPRDRVSNSVHNRQEV